MKVFAPLTLLAALGSALPTSAEEASTAALAIRAADLSSVQTAHANTIKAEAAKEKLGKHGCEAAITTGLTEASLLVYANKNVPASLKYKHDAVGSDHDSVGIFQQRVSVYKDLAADMDPARSAAQFFAEMQKIKGWRDMDVPALCQKVQRSAYPDRYQKFYPQAQQICK